MGVKYIRGNSGVRGIFREIDRFCRNRGINVRDQLVDDHYETFCFMTVKAGVHELQGMLCQFGMFFTSGFGGFQTCKSE